MKLIECNLAAFFHVTRNVNAERFGDTQWIMTVITICRPFRFEVPFQQKEIRI